ncbi:MULTISPECIES: DUF748 domain-containing protein [Anaeromyxobacter]|uniref:DUF748 domain-containing protein n=1 Tax=Anaeromyxobacter TaxID=161492 RepID=UPI001F5AC561|nr:MULTISPECIES: DUF748 domain-containing protein [unclassified Anaeromyxobacter]
MVAPSPTPARRRRLLRAAVVVAAIFVAYTALGFLAAPALLRRVLVKEGSAALHRQVTVAKVGVNPLALSITIEGLAVAHPDGTPFAGWESLYVRLAPQRLVLGEVGLAEIRLVKPSLNVGLDRKGALTFQDLLEPEAPPAAPAAPAKSGGGPRVSIGRLAVEEARVVFRDATRSPAFDTILGPVTIRLDSFRTRGGGDSPYAFTGTTESGETFSWTGTVRTEPLRSAGTLAFEGIHLPKYAPYIQDELPADLHDGRLAFETRYELEWGTARRVLALAGGKLTVDRLAMGPRGVAEPAVKLSRIEVSGIEVDALAQRAKIDEVSLRGGKVRVLREADGSLELSRMAPPPSPPSPWKWSIGALAVSGLALDLQDRTPSRPVALPLTDVALRIERLRPEADATWPVSLSLVWNGRGRLAVKGPVQPFGSKGKLEVDAAELDLVPLQPYLEPDVTARLTGGRAGARATVDFDASGKAPRWTFAGDVRLDGLAVAERGNEDLLRWRSLEVTGIDAASTPPRASVRLVRLVEPRVKAYVWEDGATSFARALRAAPAPAPGKPPPPPGPEWRTAIGAVQVVRGRAAFVDRSVSPPAIVNVTGADAAVAKLSSDPRVRSTVDVKLQVEGASPVRISGTLNPLQKEAFTELVVASQGVDLSPFATYSGKFLGYGIQKGKLDLDLRYKIENRNLASTNVVRVNQFTLGDPTNSPDATKIPVRLALALLQDRDGVILLDVPIEGNLDDPNFHLGKVIWRTVLNVLVKVATSPFSALAALAGGDHADLSLVEFAPGAAEALPSAQERFGLLARSLAQRPALGLELEGSADPDQDGPALRRAALERSLRRAKAASMRPPPPSADEVTLSPEERARLVRAAYDAAFPAAPRKSGEAAAAPPSPQEMEERLAAAVEVPAEAYRSLSAERAQRAREALLAAGIDQGRLFLTQGGERAEKEKGARVYFTVR